MIDYLKGKLVVKDPTHLIIDVNGVGYRVNISLNTYSEIKDQENMTILTYLHVKEDSHTLYGFARESEKLMFMQLISINGVGPSTGLMIQSSLSANELKDAILNNDVSTIQSVKGIGAKTAQRVILELRDKVVKTVPEDGMELFQESHNTLKKEALSALITLGINKSSAEKSIDKILRAEGNEITLENLIKQVLKNV